jgi:hypothetical protein
MLLTLLEAYVAVIAYVAVKGIVCSLRTSTEMLHEKAQSATLTYMTQLYTHFCCSTVV